MDPALVILVVLIAGLAAIVPIVYLNVQRMGETRLLLPAPEATHGNQHRLADSHGPWASHFGFEWIGGYSFRGFQQGFIGAFRHVSQPVFFVLETSGGATHYHFISAFNRDQELMTTSQSGVCMPPPPGNYVQRLPKAPLTELFLAHTAAHDLLLARGDAKLAPYPLRFDRAFVNALARQYAHVTAMSAWPLRALSWVLVEPRRVEGRTIADQLEGVEAPAPVAAAPQLHEEPPEEDEDGGQA